MKIGSLASARPQYYDRNSTFISAVNYIASTGVATVTSNTFYTVPAGKKFMLTTISISQTLTTGFAAGDQCTTFLRFDAGGGNSPFIRYMNYFTKTGETFNIGFAGGQVLNAGTTLNHYVVIQAAGGANAVTSYLYLSGTLFDE